MACNWGIDFAGMNKVTEILKAAQDGDSKATEKLLPLVYDQLRRLAQFKLANEKPGQTLNATALVHEAYLRLVKSDQDYRWDTIGHFYAAAAESMRRILVDVARRKNRIRHGGEFSRVDIDAENFAAETTSNEWASEFLDLEDALTKFAEQYPEPAKLVELRYFTGLTMNKAADAIGISRRTAQRYWAFAKAWLYKSINIDSKEDELID